MIALARRHALGLLVALLPLVPLLFALDRAVMIDDTLFLKAAEQIVQDPARPFDFTVNWYGREERFWDVFKNPPGLSYWLAAAGVLLGPRETVWHAAVFPFTVAAVAAAVWLARRFAGTSPWITAAWVASPAFLVSAATLMADVPALAFSLWGLVCWIRGAEDDRAWLRRLGAVLAGLAVVVKYTAVLGIATLALYTLLLADSARRRRHVSDLWPGMLPPAAWSLLTLATDGRNHIIDALTVGGGGIDPNPGWFAHRAIALLTFIAGTAVFPVVLVLPALRRRTGLVLAGVAVVIGVVAAIVTPLVWSPRGLGHGVVPLVGALAALGALALLVAFREALSGDREARFLAAWVALDIVYLWLWSWTVAARFVLPLLLPLLILLVRAVGARADRTVSRSTRRVFATAAALALLVSVPVLRADGEAGEFYRRAVPELSAQARREHRPLEFVGAWGFQHYAERQGLTKVNADAPVLARRALVLQPYYAANRDLPTALEERAEQVASLPGPRATLDLQTMNINVGAGFYSSVYGPLPFVRARLPVEGVLVWRVRG